MPQLNCYWSFFSCVIIIFCLIKNTFEDSASDFVALCEIKTNNDPVNWQGYPDPCGYSSGNPCDLALPGIYCVAQEVTRT